MPIIKLIHHDMRPRHTLILPFPYGGVIVTVTEFNIDTGKREREYEEAIDGPVTLYLASSRDFPGYSYRQVQDSQTRHFSCGCAEYLDVHDCPHVAALEMPV